MTKLIHGTALIIGSAQVYNIYKLYHNVFSKAWECRNMQCDNLQDSKHEDKLWGGTTARLPQLQSAT